MKIDWKLVSDGKPRTDGMILFAAKGPSLPHTICSWQEGTCQPFWTHYVPMLDILATLMESDTPQSIITELQERVERLEKFLVL